MSFTPDPHGSAPLSKTSLTTLEFNIYYILPTVILIYDVIFNSNSVYFTGNCWQGPQQSSTFTLSIEYDIYAAGSVWEQITPVVHCRNKGAQKQLNST